MEELCADTTRFAGSNIGQLHQVQGYPNRWEPVWFDRLPVKPDRPGSGSDRYETGQYSKFKFEIKKMKNS